MHMRYSAFYPRQQQQLPRASIKTVNGAVEFESSYDPNLVADMKGRIPFADRRWDRTRGVWIVAPQHAQTLADLSWAYLGVRVAVPNIASTAPDVETRTLEIYYIGSVKPLADGTYSAFGCDRDGNWYVQFPGDVLQTFVQGGIPQDGTAPKARPDSSVSLFERLLVAPSATEQEVKTAFRRMARQWHPDVCREPDAADQFKAIKAAYDVLADPLKRRRYEAGLKLEALAGPAARPSAFATSVAYQQPNPLDGYRPPLKCGLILAEGTQRLTKFVLSRILGWADLTDAQGRTLVTSWPAGADRFVEAWV